MRILSSLSDLIDSICCLLLFIANRDIKIHVLRHTRVSSFHKFNIALQIKQSTETFYGTAEGRTKNLALARALSEAYEKTSFYIHLHSNLESQSHSKMHLRGFGVSTFKNTAILRSYGEFFERKLFYSGYLPTFDDFFCEQFDTPYGSVFIVAIRKDQYLGSGYGLVLVKRE